MNLEEAVEKLEKSEEFKEWKKTHKKGHFADAFVIVDENTTSDWQLGYYDPENDKITVFLLGKHIIVKPEDAVFKKGGIVREVDLKDVKKNLDQALSICDKFCKKEYAGDDVARKIVVLQRLDVGQVWNITCITIKYNTINMKIDTETGEILDHKLTSMFDFVQK